MKKILSILVCLSLIMSLSACGGSATATNQTEAANNATETTAVSSVNTLVVGTSANFPPYEYIEGNTVVGIDAEIISEVAKDIGVKVKWEDMKFDSLISALSANKVDLVVAGMTVTEDREEFVDFSNTYATAVQSVIVKVGSGITDIDHLEGKLIGVQLGTTGDIYASDDYGADHVKGYAAGADAVLSLINGQIDAVIIDDEVAKNLANAYPGQLTLLDTAYAEEEYAMAVKKGNTKLLNQVNASIEKLRQNGTLKRIVDKYIK